MNFVGPVCRAPDNIQDSIGNGRRVRELDVVVLKNENGARIGVPLPSGKFTDLLVVALLDALAPGLLAIARYAMIDDKRNARGNQALGTIERHCEWNAGNGNVALSAFEIQAD